MTCTTIQQHQGVMYVEPGGSTHTFDSSSERYEFVTETLSERGTLIESQSTLGTRFKDVAQNRKGPTAVNGDVVFEPTPTMLDAWLPRILGAAEVPTDTFGVAETLPFFGVQFSRNYLVGQYNDCVVNSATFRGTQGQNVTLTLNLIAKTRSVGTAPSVNLTFTDAADYPYVFTDSAVTLAGTARQFESFELTVQNNVIARYNNSTTATSLCPGRSRIMFRANIDPNATSVMDDLRQVAVGGIAGVFSLTNGTVSTTFTFGKLVKADSEPTINTTSAVSWDVELEAMKDGATAIVEVVNDVTV